MNNRFQEREINYEVNVFGRILLAGTGRGISGDAVFGGLIVSLAVTLIVRKVFVLKMKMKR